MRPGPITRLLTALILGYQRWISPGFPATCRFSPTCSAYALQALRSRGALVGMALALWRVLRCHPFNAGGHDPVPHRRNRSPVPSVECSTPHPGASR